jgi:hypothetical protein
VFPSQGSASYGPAVNREHLELCASAEWRQTLRDLILPYALTGTRLGDDVLEIGPGPGLTTDLLRDEVARLTAVELDRDWPPPSRRAWAEPTSR